MKKLIFLMMAFATLISCTKKEIYSEFENDLPEKRWNEKDVKTYEFEIDDVAKNYTVFFDISHVYGTEMNVFPVNLKITEPNGTIRMKIVDIKLDNADCVGDVCDSKINIAEKLKFTEGKYKIEISPISKYGFVPNIIGVGLSVQIKE